MASITGSTDKQGGEVFKVTVTRSKQDYRETKSFSTRKQAEAWGKKREAELDKAIAEGKSVTKQRNEGKTLGDAIDLYIAAYAAEMGRTKTQVLLTIRNEYDIAKKRCDVITSQDIIAFAQELAKRPNLNSSSTIGNYLSHLQAVFTIAKPMWNLNLNLAEMIAANAVCGKLKIKTKSARRDRRPTLDELDKILTHFQAVNVSRPNSVPMHKVVAFAIFSTRRQEEITNITWDDYEEKNKRVLVRNMKNPGDKAGNNVWVDLPDPCTDIIASMPKISDRIFPYSTDAISANFTRACQKLEIEDLRFHDLRHEGVSRLFEMGKTIPLVAKVSGHRSWQSLQRYTQIMQEGDKFENWKWIPIVTEKPTKELNPKK